MTIRSLVKWGLVLALAFWLATEGDRVIVTPLVARVCGLILHCGVNHVNGGCFQ